MKNEDLYKSAEAMRSFIDNAFDYNVKGCWSGSSHGYHPRGFLRDDILYIDEWNVHNYTSIYIASERGCNWLKAENAPTAWCARAEPKPETGEKILVWSTGSWQKKGPWCERIDKMITQVRQEIEVKKKEKQEEDQVKADKKKEDQEKKEKDLVDQWS